MNTRNRQSSKDSLYQEKTLAAYRDMEELVKDMPKIDLGFGDKKDRKGKSNGKAGGLPKIDIL